MIRLRVTVRDGGAAQALRAAAERLPDDLAALTGDAAKTLQASLKKTTPVGKQVPGGRTPGSLQKSIMFDLAGTKATFAASQVAEYVIGGTEAHDIEGKSGPLHFYWEAKGGFVTFMRVHHPGTRPNDFRGPAVDEAAADAEQLLEQVGDQILGRLGQ